MCTETVYLACAASSVVPSKQETFGKIQFVDMRDRHIYVTLKIVIHLAAWLL